MTRVKEAAQSHTQKSTDTHTRWVIPKNAAAARVLRETFPSAEVEIASFFVVVVVCLVAVVAGTTIRHYYTQLGLHKGIFVGEGRGRDGHTPLPLNLLHDY